MFRKSYRLKVAAWSALVSGIVLLVFMVFTVRLMRDEQRGLTEHDVGALANMLLIELSMHEAAGETVTEFADAMSRQPEAQLLLFAVIAPDGRYIYHDNYLWKDQYFNSMEEQRSVVTDNGEWRIRRYRLQGWEVFIGNKLEDTEHEYIEMAQAFSVALPISLLLIAAGGWWIAWQSMRPIQSISKVISDVESKNLSQRVPESNREDEIGSLAKSINQMLERVERGYQQARRFTADASHELRTPLAILQAELENRLGDDEARKEDQQAYVRMLEEVHQLKTLTHTLLFLSRVDAGIVEIERKPVQLIQMIEHILEEFREMPETENLTIEFEKENDYNEVIGDAQLFRQVVFNLVQNAVKYNREGGKILLQSSTREELVQVTIGNNGAIVPENEQKRIFDRFFTCRTERGRKAGGFGLGLNLAREIARIHGGDVMLVSSKDDWTEFAFILPKYAH